MRHLNRPKYVIVGTLSLIYLFCGIYIGCEPDKQKKKNPPPAAKTPETTSTEKKDPKDENAGGADDKDKDPKSNGASATEDDEENLDGDESEGLGASGSSSSKSSFTLKFTSQTKVRAFCSIPSNTLLNLVKSLDGLSSSDLKGIANSKIGKLFTYDQIKGFKSLAGTIKLSQINSLKSQICNGAGGGNGDEEVEEDVVEEEVDDEG